VLDATDCKSQFGCLKYSSNAHHSSPEDAFNKVSHYHFRHQGTYRNLSFRLCCSFRVKRALEGRADLSIMRFCQCEPPLYSHQPPDLDLEIFGGPHRDRQSQDLSMNDSDPWHLQLGRSITHQIRPRVTTGFRNRLLSFPLPLSRCRNPFRWSQRPSSVIADALSQAVVPSIITGVAANTANEDCNTHCQKPRKYGNKEKELASVGVHSTRQVAVD
jgi:hypothetical protein